MFVYPSVFISKSLTLVGCVTVGDFVAFQQNTIQKLSYRKIHVVNALTFLVILRKKSKVFTIINMQKVPFSRSLVVK